MALTVNPTLPVSAPASASAATPQLVPLQPGTVVDAQVQTVLAQNLVRVAIANMSLDVMTEIPLQPGQTLQLAVSQTANGLRLAIVGQGGDTAQAAITSTAQATIKSVTTTAAQIAQPPRVDPLTPLERVAVSVAAEKAASQQQSLAPLFADLDVAATLDVLPPDVKQAVQQVLALKTPLAPNLGAADIQDAFQSSGLFLEASLASGSVPASGPIPDLKAALIVLRQALSALETTIAQSPGTPLAAAAGTAPASAPQPLPISGQAAASSPQMPAVQQGATPAAQLATPQGQVSPTAPPPSPTPVLSMAPVVASSEPIPTAVITTPSPATPNGAAPQQPASPQSPLAAQQPQVTIQVPSSVAVSLPSGPADAMTPDGRGAPLDSAPPADTAASRMVMTDTLLKTIPHAATPGVVLALLQEALQELPRAGGNATATRSGGMPHGAVDTAMHPGAPPPMRGALPAPQAIASPSIAPDTPLATTAHRLIEDTDAALARQTLLQIASLPDRVDQPAGHTDPTAPRWNFEIPFATPQGTAMAQFEIARDGGGTETDASGRVWRARFTLDIEPAGPVHALISLSGERTSVRMWAERPATAAMLRAGAGELTQALTRAELTPGDIVVREGTPPQPAPAKAGHFLDRAL